MANLNRVLLTGSRLLGRFGLQVAGSVAAAVVVAQLVGPVSFGPAALEAVLGRKTDGPVAHAAASPFVAPAERILPEFPVSVRWTQPSLLELAEMGGDDFPMEADIRFDTSLSRPFLSEYAVATPKRHPLPTATDKPAKPQPRIAVASAVPVPQPRAVPPPPAPERTMPSPVVAAADIPPASIPGAAAVPAPARTGLLPFDVTRFVPSAGDILGGVQAATGSLLKFARLD
jgi:hypothetical protein